MALQPHLALWAKLGTSEYPNNYHPLLFHLIDVGTVARHLWDVAFRPPARQRFAAAFGADVETCRAWVAFIAGAHDIGKCSPGFQRQGNSATLVGWLGQRGFDFLHSQTTPHATASVPLLRRFLQEERRFTSRLATRLAIAIGGHHGTFPETESWGQLDGTSQLGQMEWPACQHDLLLILADLLMLPGKPPAEGEGDDQSYLMVLAGLTTVADWVGSNKAFFPPRPPANWQVEGEAALQQARAYFAGADERAARALATLGWHQRGPAIEPRKTFGDLFAHLKLPALRPLQEKAEALATTMSGPGLVLVEAPMGEGKTEAALCLADAWDHQGGQGFYIALPTMATSNGMFGRVVDFIKANYPGRQQLHLLHGRSLLSPAYEQLRANAEASTDADIYDADHQPRSVVADEWFARDKKQGLLAPFAVGTIDQALLAVLQTKHMFVRLFGLAGKVVILDEVHAYDAYMTTLLERLLEWLSALGSPVILLSATLPRAKRHALLNAYGGPSATISEEVPYPRMCVVRPGATDGQAEHVPASGSKTIQLEWRDGDLGQLASALAKALEQGGCAAVVRNTVGLAQQTYQALKASLPADVELHLFHARFLFGDRQRIEGSVLTRYGKGETQRPRKAVLVATQVIEQSLDLDFDLMVSDAAPVDLILQRAGRLWRHERTRPPGLTQPTLWLLKPTLAADGVPNFGVSEYIYDRYVLLCSYLALQQDKAATVHLPDDVEALIEAVYGSVSLTWPADGAWRSALTEAAEAMKADNKAYRKWAKGIRITKPIYGDEILQEFSKELEEDNPEGPQCRHAATRLAEPSVALVVLFESNGTLFFDAAGQRPAHLDSVPKLEHAKEFLGNVVTVGHKGCVFHYLKKPTPAVWEKCGLLRHHRVVRVNTGGQALSGEYPLMVHPELGILFTQPDDKEL
jgi:CRISPR-associated endonuclease/helicase Cas3